MRIDNSTFESLEEFKYLGTTLTNQNSTAEEKEQFEIRKWLLSFGAESFVFQVDIQKFKAHRTTIVPVVSYGCEILSLILREESKLRVFENMVLRGIFGPRRDEVTGDWRRLHNDELNYL